MSVEPHIDTRDRADASIYEESFQRNLGLISETEQLRLRSSTVAIAGLGGVGGLHMVTLARMGVGGFHVADNDTFEPANINRQYGATVDTIGRKKTDVMAETVASINPKAMIRIFEKGVDESNIDDFLENVDVVIDGIDFFEVDARRLLFNKAREKGIYAVTCGPIGFGATLQVFSPDGMSFDEYFGISDDMGYWEKMVAFAVGLTPRALHLKYLDLSKVNIAGKTGPALASACNLCATLAATEAVSIILGRRTVKAVPYYFQFDPYRRVYKKGYLFMGAGNPVQRLKRWLFKRKIKPLLAKK